MLHHSAAPPAIYYLRLQWRDELGTVSGRSQIRGGPVAVVSLDAGRRVIVGRPARRDSSSVFVPLIDLGDAEIRPAQMNVHLCVCSCGNFIVRIRSLAELVAF